MDTSKNTKLEEQLNSFSESLESLQEKTTNHENLAELIHHTFRLIHNIKSNLFLVDQTKSLKLTYFLERYFEKLRNGKNKITVEVITLFKNVISWIKSDISNIVLDDTVYLELMKGLKNMKMNSESNGNKINLSSDEKSLLRDARNSGLNIFIVEDKIQNNISRKEFRILPLINLINEIGMIVLLTPDFNKIDKNKSDEMIQLKIIFVTDKNQNELQDPLLRSAETFEEDLFLNSKDYKILIIEDNPVVSLLQRSIMSEFGICDTVSEGISGLELFKLAQEEDAPYDIVLLDLVMPGIDGSVVLKNIRELEEKKGIKGLDRSKVIVSTTTQDSSTLIDLFRAETDSYIIKPLTKEKIVKEMTNLKMI